MYASIYIYVMLLIHPNLIFHFFPQIHEIYNAFFLMVEHMYKWCWLMMIIFFFLEIRFSVIWWWHEYEYDAGDGEMLDAELNFLWSFSSAANEMTAAVLLEFLLNQYLGWIRRQLYSENNSFFLHHKRK